MSPRSPWWNSQLCQVLKPWTSTSLVCHYSSAPPDAAASSRSTKVAATSDWSISCEYWCAKRSESQGGCRVWLLSPTQRAQTLSLTGRYTSARASPLVLSELSPSLGWGSTFCSIPASSGSQPARLVVLISHAARHASACVAWAFRLESLFSWIWHLILQALETYSVTCLASLWFWSLEAHSRKSLCQTWRLLATLWEPLPSVWVLIAIVRALTLSAALPFRLT